MKFKNFFEDKMTKIKVLKVDEKMEKSLTNICDAALRYHGLQIMNTVVEVASAIRDQEEEKHEERNP
jgi:hypothetical protein